MEPGAEIEAIKARLEQLAQAIEEVKARLPAHSVKPPIMHELLALEDEYEALLARLEELGRR